MFGNQGNSGNGQVPQQGFAPQQNPFAPQQGFAPQQNPFAPQQAPQGFAPQQGYPQQGGMRQLTAAEKQAAMQGAMSGFGGAKIDTRVPDMMPPYSYLLDITEATYDVGVEAGPYLKYAGKILQTNDPNYPEGTIVGYRVTGANSMKGRNFYYSDLKAFMLCVPKLLAQGLNPNIPEEQWAPGLLRMSQEQLAVGAHIGFQMSYVGQPYTDRKTGQQKPGKIKATFIFIPNQPHLQR